MPRVTFIAHNGGSREVEIESGSSLMAGAVSAQVDGILGDCGGACSCATCHVHVAPEWFDRLPPRGEHEEAMLEMALAPDETSRLSCQILLAPELDGLVVTLPESQI